MYGDQGWDGQQAVDGQGPYDGQQDAYGRPYQDQQYPQQPQYPHQQDPQQQQNPQYQQQHPQYQQQHPQYQQQDPQWGGGPQQYSGQQQYWDASQGGGAPYGDGVAAGDPYGQQPVDPYNGGHPDYYGTQDAYPPPQPQNMRQQQAPQQDPQQAQQPQNQQPQNQQPQNQQPQNQQQHPQAGPEPTDEWNAGPAEPEHAFFAGGRDADDDDDDEDPREERRSARGRNKKKPKRRSGLACLVVTVVLVGGVGAAGYFGYEFWNEHFGAAPDFTGKGSGEVQLEIPAGAGTGEMGRILKSAGVVKSADAFVSAAEGEAIQAGTYTLRKEMSAADAVAMMTDPKAQNGLIIPEGLRATQIYERIDQQISAKKGTTAAVAKKRVGELGLPPWAGGRVEGFLFPSKYSVGKKSKPVDVLKQMVKRAESEFVQNDLKGNARKVGKKPYEVLVIASLVQAEAQEDHEFGKVSRVIYNRLDIDMTLGFDSTINYAKGRSTLDTTTEDTQFDSPYNTYLHKGLPPGPIGNPGHQAIEAALAPTKGDWLYFVTVKPGDTRFTKSDAEHQKNVQDFNKYQREH
ncbi:endolytic transglycosylase MltG [Streptomyces sp. H27-D2]|uniref:endolytic transglycosylase MltG n=1 Tax=Streptomyces sp. H27-D2 TaxID=3046304 RepID=UPI002DBEE0CE|nr:endolytic transglycosylase MltG [Streptomyces sp. H27-D2]MEC4015561.1 endolytic transglycosylase MltG [Streptomyces sp. H27-D2]